MRRLACDFGGTRSRKFLQTGPTLRGLPANGGTCGVAEDARGAFYFTQIFVDAR
jgi:hypothetical protein